MLYLDSVGACGILTKHPPPDPSNETAVAKYLDKHWDAVWQESQFKEGAKKKRAETEARRKQSGQEELKRREVAATSSSAAAAQMTPPATRVSRPHAHQVPDVDEFMDALARRPATSAAQVVNIESSGSTSDDDPTYVATVSPSKRARGGGGGRPSANKARRARNKK